MTSGLDNRSADPKNVEGETFSQGHEQQDRSAELHTTLLETTFPFRELSLVAKAERRVRDPVYGMHRWWARRPPSLLRGLLIASHLPADETTEEFWRLFGSAERPLAGRSVLDPFAGGGSTLVEADQGLS